MKSHELAKVLLSLENLEVYTAIDEEGNGFSNTCIPQIEWMSIEGNSAYERIAVHPDDVGTEFDEEDLEKAIVIWP